MNDLPKKALAAMKAAPATLAASLEDIRLRIVAAMDAKAEIERAPVDAQQASDRVRTWATSLRNEVLSRLGPERFASPAYRPPGPTESLDLVLAVLAPSVEVELAPMIARYCAEARGLSASDRGELLTKADAAILDLELAEEALIRAAEASGLAILRRGDADPRAVLAHSENLP